MGKLKINFELIHASRLIQVFINVSRFIQKPLSRTRKNGLDMGNHESQINKKHKSCLTKKNSPNHVSQKKYKGPSQMYEHFVPEKIIKFIFPFILQKNLNTCILIKVCLMPTVYM